jgi:hypothetical protein
MAGKYAWHEFQNDKKKKKKFLNYGIKTAKSWNGSGGYYKIQETEKNQ